MESQVNGVPKIKANQTVAQVDGQIFALAVPKTEVRCLAAGEFSGCVLRDLDIIG
jgi:hypothetical protein